MRRTKSDTLHPASQVIAAALSQYLDPEEDVIRYRPGGPQDSLWHDLPVLPILGNDCVVIKGVFQNADDISTDYWRQFIDPYGATPVSIVEQQGGGIYFKTGNGGKTYNFLQSQNRIFQFKPLRNTWMQTYARTTSLGGNGDITFGLTDTYSNENPTWYKRPENGVVFTFILEDENPSVTVSSYREDIVPPYPDLPKSERETLMIDPALSPDPTQPHKYGVHIYPSDMSLPLDGTYFFDVAFYIDSDYVGTIEGIVITDDLLGASVGTWQPDQAIILNDIIVFQEYE